MGAAGGDAVKPAPFDYVAVTSLAEAVQALAAAGGDAKVLAGGQSLVPLMNLRLARPAVLVDINGIPGLDGIAVRPGHLALGALVRHADLAADAAVTAGWPVLHDAANLIGHPAIRNRGTVGGSLAHADPAAELPAVLAVLGGSVVAEGPRGAREIAAADLFVTYLTTSLEPDEILTEVRLPSLPPGAGSAFVEFARRHGDFALVGAAAVVATDGGRVTEARLALVGVGATPVRVDLGSLRGEPAGGGTWAAAGRLAAAAVDPDSDIHAPAAYRRELAGVMAERALARAAARAGGSAG
jgi:carbon-monoxide dehydrogenase medium subunit